MMPEMNQQTSPQQVTLNDGTVIDNARAIESNDRLFVYCDGLDIKTGFDKFYENTMTVVAESYEERRVYTGYGVLYSVSAEYGNCNVALKKG